jgi:alkanesulfonate monooxygenase SsuD/methylene tetrahydromethanopterin reductase-like flavin-dependent oxidoreductase (luciferase family)
LRRRIGKRGTNPKKASCISTAGSATSSKPRRPAPARAIEQRAERGQRLQTITYEEALRDKVVLGTAERVTDRLHALREELGLDGILAEMNCGSLIAHQRVMRPLQLLCEKVMPNFD